MRDLAYEAVAFAFGFGLLVVGALVVRARRARWTREVGIYESYRAFASRAKDLGIAFDLGRLLVVGAAARLFGDRSVTVRVAYDELLLARRCGALGDGPYRGAIDALLEHAATRRRL